MLPIVGSSQLGTTTETHEAYLIVRSPGVYSSLRLYVSANTVTGGTTNCQSRKNSATGNMSFNITAGAAGYHIVSSGSDTVADGDTYGSLLTVGTGGNLVTEWFGIDFQSTSDCVNVIRTSSIGTVTASSTEFSGVQTFAESNADAEVLKQIKSPLAGVTWENFQIQMGVNARTTTTTLKARKNAADLTYSQAILATNDDITLEDATTQESIGLDDLFNWSTTTGTGTGLLSLNSAISHLVHANSFMALACPPGTPGAQNAALTRYNPIIGRSDAWTTEAQCQLVIKGPVRFSLPRIYVKANSINTGTSTLNIRKNGSTILTVSVAAGATGWHEQATGSVDCEDGDLLSISRVTSGSSGSLTWGNFVMIGSPLISVDATSNSGEQLASSSYSWSHTCSFNDRYLTVKVGMLSLAQTVSGITYNSVAMTFLGAQSSVSGAARIELWGLIAPSTGSNTIAVTLTGAINSGATAVSYNNVHQTTPTESFNSAQATNVGAADATVSITPIASDTRIVDGVATDDTSITVGAGQIQRNNIAGTVGTVADSDEGIIATPAATTMSWTGIGAAATWSIGGFALRPLTATSPTTPTITISLNQLMMMGAGT